MKISANMLVWTSFVIIFTCAPYKLIPLTDEIMGIPLHKTLHNNVRAKHRHKFKQDLGFNFKIGYLSYRRDGSASNWDVVWKMPSSHDKNHPHFQGAVVDAIRDAPTYLSRRESKDAIDSISFACGAQKKKCRALLYAMLPDTLSPMFWGNECSKERQFLADTTKLILSRDNSTDLEMVTDMRRFNCRGNNDLSKFELFWDYCSHVLDLENEAGAHYYRHAASDESTTTSVAYAPGVLSVPQLIKKIVELLTDDNKMQPMD